MASFADSDEALLDTPRDEAHARRCDHCGSWRAVRRANGYAAAGQQYWAGQRSLVAALMRVSSTIVAQADDGLLDGFLCADTPTARAGDPVIHYVYVRLSARGKGVARALCSTLGPAARILYTHRSRTLESARLPKVFVYDRYRKYWSFGE